MCAGLVQGIPCRIHLKVKISDRGGTISKKAKGRCGLGA